MSSFTAQQCWVMMGIIAVMLIACLWRHPAPGLSGDCTPPPEALAGERQPFVVEVTGGVARPGVYSFSCAVDVAQVIRAADGLEEGVAVPRAFLSRVLLNGSALSIGRDGASSAVTMMDAQKRFLFFVPFAINRAGAEELLLVPGIGEKTAREIVSYRDRHGCFTSLDALLEVPGIGPRSFTRMKDFLVL